MDVVTGATGHLGNVLTRMLVARGRRVRALARAQAGELAGVDVEVARADLRDTAGLAAAFRGASTVYHTAGLVSFGAGGRAEMYEINCRGTRRVLEACRRAGVGRLVHVASIEALDLSAPVITEAGGFRPERTVLVYGRTKALAARSVLAAAATGLDAVVICPTGFIGPQDHRLGAMGRLVVDYAHRRLPAVVRGGFDFVDVRDVASGAILAAERGRRGESYILSGRYVSVRELMDRLHALTGVRGPCLWLPLWLAMPAAAAAEVWYRASGLPPRFTRGSVRLLSLGVRVSSEKARRELGYTPRDLGATLRDTVEWFRETGGIPGAGGNSPRA